MHPRRGGVKLSNGPPLSHKAARRVRRRYSLSSSRSCQFV